MREFLWLFFGKIAGVSYLKENSSSVHFQAPSSGFLFETWHRSVLILVISLGVFLRFFRLSEPQFWLDEILRLVRFSSDSLWENLLDIRADVATVPLDYLVQSFFIRIWGLSEFSARFHAAFFGAASVVVIFLFARWALNRDIAVLSALFLAVNPLHLFYSREAANYATFHFLVLCSYFLLLKALLTGTRWYWIGYGLLSVLTLYTNYLGITHIAAQAMVLVFFFLVNSKEGKEFEIRPNRSVAMRSFVISLVIAGGLFLPWAVWTFGSTSQHYPSPFEPGLPLRIFKELSGGSYPLAILLTSFAVYGLIRLWQTNRREVAILLMGWMLIPLALTLILDWWRGYFFAIRQIIPSVSALLIAVSLGVDGFHRGQRSESRRYFVTGIILVAILASIGTFILSSKKPQADWVMLSRHLESTVLEEDLIVAPNIERVVEFRYPPIRQKRIPLSSVPNLRTSGRDLRVHVIESRYATVDQIERISLLLEEFHPEQSVSIPGFEIHQLVPGTESAPAK